MAAISAAPIHLNPQTDLAPRVLLPGDPQRALLIAQALLDSPRMFNTRRGLWGYSGLAPDGEPVTVQSTGMGGPSAAIVCEELIALGARTLVRVGTCGALSPELGLGDLVVAAEAIGVDGASRALGADGRARGDAELTAALSIPARARVTAISTDLFYDSEGRTAELRRLGGDVVEMETAALFTLAAARGVAAASLLAVTDVLTGERARVDDAQLETLGARLGEAALGALAKVA